MTSDRAGEQTQTIKLQREDEALVELVLLLREDGYRFTTVTPLTQQRVNGRPGNDFANDVAGVFGWSRPFSPELLSHRILALMRAARVLLTESDGWCRSRIRAARQRFHRRHTAYRGTIAMKNQ